MPPPPVGARPTGAAGMSPGSDPALPPPSGTGAASPADTMQAPPPMAVPTMPGKTYQP
jgi:hypothetical protein